MEIHCVIVLLCECMGREEWKSRLFLRPWPKIRNLPDEEHLLSLMSVLTGQRIKSFRVLSGDTEDFEVKRKRTSWSRRPWESVSSVPTLCTYRRKRLSEPKWRVISGVAEDSVHLGSGSAVGWVLSDVTKTMLSYLPESCSPRKKFEILEPWRCRHYEPSNFREPLTQRHSFANRKDRNLRFDILAQVKVKEKL
jgi:hypothetical protein